MVGAKKVPLRLSIVSGSLPKGIDREGLDKRSYMNTASCEVLVALKPKTRFFFFVFFQTRLFMRNYHLKTEILNWLVSKVQTSTSNNKMQIRCC